MYKIGTTEIAGTAAVNRGYSKVAVAVETVPCRPFSPVRQYCMVTVNVALDDGKLKPDVQRRKLQAAFSRHELLRRSPPAYPDLILQKRIDAVKRAGLSAACNEKIIAGTPDHIGVGLQCPAVDPRRPRFRRITEQNPVDCPAADFQLAVHGAFQVRTQFLSGGFFGWQRFRRQSDFQCAQRRTSQQQKKRGEKFFHLYNFLSVMMFYLNPVYRVPSR